MTLDELTMIARRVYIDSNGETVQDDFRAAVLAVLDAVERECVPPEVEVQTWGNFDRADAWNDCRDQMLDKLAEMRK